MCCIVVITKAFDPNGPPPHKFNSSQFLNKIHGINDTYHEIYKQRKF